MVSELLAGAMAQMAPFNPPLIQYDIIINSCSDFNVSGGET